MVEIVRDICDRKRGRVHPVLATELEIKSELHERGISWTNDTFLKMCQELTEHPQITTIRTLNQKAYAYDTETAEKGIPTQEGGARAKNTCEHPILSEPAVAQSEKDLSRGTPPVCGVSGEGGDNTSDDSGSHQTNQYWWSEI